MKAFSFQKLQQVQAVKNFLLPDRGHGHQSCCFHPAGVYFEARYGLGLGKLVIWTCRKDQFDERVHFDTRPYNHILWESEGELREKLRDRIRALVSDAKTA